MFLIDTHVLLWLLVEPRKVPTSLRATIEKTSTRVFVSSGSFWEIAIKASIGKLDCNLEELHQQIGSLNFEELPIKITHTKEVASLPLYHRDPFDRILVAQARIEKLQLLTADPLITQYDVKTRWK